MEEVKGGMEKEELKEGRGGSEEGLLEGPWLLAQLRWIGSRFIGWQSQTAAAGTDGASSTEGTAVEDEVLCALRRIFKPASISVMAPSRLDSGTY